MSCVVLPTGYHVLDSILLKTAHKFHRVFFLQAYSMSKDRIPSHNNVKMFILRIQFLDPVNIQHYLFHLNTAFKKLSTSILIFLKACC